MVQLISEEGACWRQKRERERDGREEPRRKRKQKDSDRDEWMDAVHTVRNNKCDVCIGVCSQSGTLNSRKDALSVSGPTCQDGYSHDIVCTDVIKVGPGIILIGN